MNFIEEKVKAIENKVSDNQFSAELLNLNGHTIRKYKNLFSVDPMVQKIRNWDERAYLYEVQAVLKNINVVYDKLGASEEVLNEWLVSVNDINPKTIWAIEQRFSAKYKNIFRVFSSTYKNDKKIISEWCSAHLPHKHSDYLKISIAAADKLRLQVKFEKMMSDFIDEYATDDSIIKESSVALADSVSKILSFLETANIDRLNSEIKTLVSATELSDTFKQIFGYCEDLFERGDFLNYLTKQNFVNEEIGLEDFLKYCKSVIKDYKNCLEIFGKASEYLTNAPQTLELLGVEVTKLNQLREILIGIQEYNPEKYIGPRDYTNLIGIQDDITEQRKQIISVLQLIGTDTFSKEDFYASLETLYSRLESWRDWYSMYDAVKKGLQLLMNNEEALENFEQVEISEFSEYIDRMLVDKDGLEKWIKLQRIKSQLSEYHMEWFYSDILERGTRGVNFSDIFTWSYINKHLADVYESESVLKNFNVNDYSRYINEFKKLENEVFETNQYRILSKVYRNMMSAMNHGGNSEKVLVRESQKIQRHLPIRKLVTDNASHLLNYKPCWMMSPLTLSSYIPYGSIKFDVVIFDEASQMKIENALGAIARASQAVVIGDEHQLPPTSFFDVASEDDEEDMEEVGFESILQSAITILPGAQSELLYHYRSTSDDLIAFSNNYIYENRLITFPSPKYKENAVQFEFVENGVYDAGQTRRNRIEAVRVADLCMEHVKNSSSTLGVIAFSKAQEEAIRDAISEKIKEFPQLSDKLDEVSDKKESFFIKNLESVQGDERDIIILSVGYGPDQNNNVFNRFGPLNSKGGV